MRVTPTRRRRRGNGTIETWTSEGDEMQQQEQQTEIAVAEVPTLALPTHALATSSPELDRPLRVKQTASVSASPQSPPPPPVGGMQSVDTILAATELLHRLEQLQAEVERAASYAGGDEIYLAHDYRAACTDLIKQFPWLALSKDIDQRLWSSWQRELAALEGHLTVAATAAASERGRLKAEGEKKLRDALYVALRNYSALIQEVQVVSRETIAAVTATKTTSLLVHRLSLAQAHVMYALEIHSTSQDKKKNWRTPELYYQRAWRWCVAQGETHYHLARIVLHDNRCAEALYHLVRARVATTPFESPDSLADQFVHVSSLRDSTTNDGVVSETEQAWVQLDRVVLSAVAPHFGQQQGFMAHRQTPLELTSALCTVLDAICRDSADSELPEVRDATVAAGSLQIVRIVCLLIACACLKTDVVQSMVATLPEGVDVRSIHNVRAIELLVAVVNGVLHRVLCATTSPLRSAQQKEHALQLMLPSITIAFAWLVKIQWRGMVAETTRVSCEQLSTMVLTSVIAGGFLAPHEDHTTPVDQPLVEEVEVMGFQCYEGIVNATATEPAPAVDDAFAHGDDSLTDRELLQRRIVKFLSYVESFMTPRPTAAAVIASATPASPIVDDATTNDTARRLDQVSMTAHSRQPTTTEGGSSASNSTTTSHATGIVRELWTPTKPTTRSTSTSKSKTKSDAQISKPPTAAGTASLSASVSERVVVLDAANIAMRHGLQRRFSCRGIQLCAEHFIAQGDRVVAFLPDYCLDVDADGSFRRRVAPSGSGGGGGGRGRRRCTISPDDRVLLEILVDSGVVVLTPAMDSDDLYCIHYARRHDAFLVTNDLFRDHISETDGPKARQVELRNWLQTRRISYTWVADEFLPNPNSAYEKLRLTAAAATAASTTTTTMAS